MPLTWTGPLARTAAFMTRRDMALGTASFGDERAADAGRAGPVLRVKRTKTTKTA
jgi:hypothetical protein